MPSATWVMILELTPIRSSRLMPGLRGRPAVRITSYNVCYTKLLRDSDRETGMRIAAGPYGIREKQAVQPAVDNTVTRAQCHTGTLGNERRKIFVHLDVSRLGISSRMAEGLHEHGSYNFV